MVQRSKSSSLAVGRGRSNVDDSLLNGRLQQRVNLRGAVVSIAHTFSYFAIPLFASSLFNALDVNSHVKRLERSLMIF